MFFHNDLFFGNDRVAAKRFSIHRFNILTKKKKTKKKQHKAICVYYFLATGYLQYII